MTAVPEPAAEWEVAIHGTDLEWWKVSGFCGGCGEETCHPGKPCTDEPTRWLDQGSACGLCGYRKAQGVFV